MIYVKNCPHSQTSQLDSLVLNISLIASPTFSCVVVLLIRTIWVVENLTELSQPNKLRQFLAEC